ncbi:hypothetical protein PI95_001675 [Hassallia byssoidea VB512170]|uniref:Uncharacterized protein n=1 Tax=Hassallia byssoidea VB512170 TaxID=1304833 RepID=A0A846H1R0_9CYAN|nr:hypothetical protein [Hassalia byssoidea]NEU71325.1 hypothetical protein [Hassalia byssoidea VB512170]
MVLIRDIVQQALNTGSLSIPADEQLQQLLQTEFEEKDIDALMLLQEAVQSGRVRKEYRNPYSDRPTKNKNKRGIIKMKLLCPSAVGVLVLGTIVFALPKDAESVHFPTNNANVTQFTLE